MSSILTYTGKSFDPLRPDPELVDIRDIAHALSNLCRFTGHTYQFYSVAEHSCRVSDLVPERDALWGLLHDASEAYLGDLARPLKQAPYFGGAYRDAEYNLMSALMFKFGLDYLMPDSVHQADNALLLAERNEFLPMNDDARLVWPEGETDLVLDEAGWAPNIAKDEFLSRYSTLVGSGVLA
jgi:hypothetical protein